MVCCDGCHREIHELIDGMMAGKRSRSRVMSRLVRVFQKRIIAIHETHRELRKQRNATDETSNDSGSLESKFEG